VSESRSQTTGRSRGRGHSSAGAGPFAARTGSGSAETSQSQGTSDSDSLTDGINASTSWGITTSRAIGLNSALGQTVQRSREFLVEPDELQRLPPSAVIVSYALGARRHVVLADANPAICTLPTATVHSPARAWQAGDRAPRDGSAGQPAGRRARPAGQPAGPAGQPAGPAGQPAGPAGQPAGPAGQPAGPAGQPAGWRSGGRQPPPNLGLPPEPPDWRRR